MQRTYSETQKNLFCVFTIFGILLVRFFKTIFFSQTLSKLFLLPHWDTLFYSMRSGQPFHIDQSLIQQHLPNKFFIADYWQHGFPLWNNLSGFGMPLLADPQTFVFSPLFALFYMFPHMYMWNLILILELFIAGISLYFLSKEFGLNQVAALATALLFVFCPWVDWQLELLGNGICLTPFVFLFFVRLGKKPSIKNAILAGISAAVYLLSAHPEMAFIALSFSVMLALIMAYHTKANLITTCIYICLAGLISSGLSAPCLIPFGEYLLNGNIYKFVVLETRGESIFSVLGHTLFPFRIYDSLYLGPLSWFGLIAVFSFNKSRLLKRALIICLLISILIMIRPSFLEPVFKIPPLSMICSIYCIPAYLVFNSVLSGIGISYLFEGENRAEKKTTMLFCSLIISFALVPIILNNYHDSFIHGLNSELYQFSFQTWAFTFVCAVFMYFIWAKNKKRNTYWSYVVFVFLGILNLIVISIDSLAARPTFQYPSKLPIQIEHTTNTRIISEGKHLFQPNTNLVYKLPMAQVLNPLLPKGFVQFLADSGAQVNAFYQLYPLKISRLLNLAGVSNVLSIRPIIDENIINHEAIEDKKGLNISATYTDLIDITNLKILQDKNTGDIFCRLIAIRRSNSVHNHYICFSVINNQGRVLSTLEPKAIDDIDSTGEVLFSAFMPKEQKHWKIAITVKDDATRKLIEPTKLSFGTKSRDGGWLLDSDKPGLVKEIDNNRFEIANNYLGIYNYRNKAAFPRYFFAKDIIWTGNKLQAALYTKNNIDNLRRIVILEELQRNSFKKSLSQAGVNFSGVKQIVFNQAGTIEVLNDKKNEKFRLWPQNNLETNVPKISLLVCSDLYFPGWCVYIDGKKQRIFRADTNFRAAIIPAGKHLVQFQYEPLSFIIGASIFFVTAFSLVFLWLKSKE